MNTLTLRSIPKPVEQRLRRIARESHKSLNKTAIELLEKAVGLGEEAKSKKRREIRGILHQWTQDEVAEFERSIEVFESIDEEVWR
ncbi:MAG: hypothetical protein GF398_16860 [Chitinivibrionales bacterium]|nr:hypothetical protein [Chitinivibrionales bacterium]